MSQILSSHHTDQALSLKPAASNRRAGTRFAGLMGHLTLTASSLFKNPLRGLTYDQTVGLEQLLLKQLAKRSVLWIGILFIGSIAVLFLGDRRVIPQSLPMGIPFTKELWLGGLWTLLLTSAYVLPRVMHLSGSGSSLHRTRVMHLLLCAWIVCVALVWFSGSQTLLLPQPPPPPEAGKVPQPPPFKFNEMTFIFFTLIGQVVTIVLLAPSRIATTSALALGFLCPFILLWTYISHENPFFYQMIFWIGGQGALDLALAWFVGTDQRRIYARGVRAEAERQRADNFVATISHDLRQPVTALALKLSVMSDRHLSPEIEGGIRFLRDQVKAIEQMVVGTLDLSKIHSGTLRFTVRPVASNYLLDGVVSSLRAEAASIGSKIEVKTLPYLISTDQTGFERIVRNLINNALRYSEKSQTGRPGRVVVECNIEDDLMRVSVTDNGLGIPGTKLDDIFKEYVQLGNPERDNSKGLGLGLSIVKGYADRLGHRLDVHSIVGEGSTFSVLVPIVGPIPPELITQADDDIPVPDLTGMTVIVVEDMPDVRSALYDLLLDWNCCVVDGGSSEEALSLLRAEVGIEPNLILSGYNLGNQANGIDCVKEIREALGMPLLPAAIFTGDTDPRVQLKIYSAGLSLLRKPLESNVLLELLRRHAPKRACELSDQQDLEADETPLPANQQSERSRAEDFVDTVGHDLRNHVTAIAVHLSNMKEKRPSEETAGDITFLEKQVKAIAEMVTATLDIAKIKSGVLRLDVKPVSISALVEATVDSLRPKAMSAGSQIGVTTLPYLVSTDAGIFTRILHNLVENALRYSDKSLTGRAGRVFVRCTIEDAFVRVSVTDNGIGIPKDQVKEIFGKFVQLRNSDANGERGYGLGLAFVKDYADQLNHRIQVESRVGEGSTFSILLPVLGLIPEEPPKLVARRKPLTDIMGMVVLLIEDASGPRAALRETLLSWSCRVIDGESAEDVLTKLKSDGSIRPDFILADYRLREGETGLNCMRSIRDALGNPSLPGAIWTAETDPEILRKIDSAGLALLSKPPNLQALRELLGRQAKNKRLDG